MSNFTLLKSEKTDLFANFFLFRMKYLRDQGDGGKGNGAGGKTGAPPHPHGGETGSGKGKGAGGARHPQPALTKACSNRIKIKSLISNSFLEY